MCEAEFTGMDAGEYYAMRDFEEREKKAKSKSKVPPFKKETLTHDFPVNIAGHTLEYIEDGHIYLVDGVIVPSITEMLKSKFGHKYD